MENIIGESGKALESIANVTETTLKISGVVLTITGKGIAAIAKAFANSCRNRGGDKWVWKKAIFQGDGATTIALPKLNEAKMERIHRDAKALRCPFIFLEPDDDLGIVGRLVINVNDSHKMWQILEHLNIEYLKENTTITDKDKKEHDRDNDGNLDSKETNQTIVDNAYEQNSNEENFTKEAKNKDCSVASNEYKNNDPSSLNGTVQWEESKEQKKGILDRVNNIKSTKEQVKDKNLGKRKVRGDISR